LNFNISDSTGRTIGAGIGVLFFTKDMSTLVHAEAMLTDSAFDPNYLNSGEGGFDQILSQSKWNGFQDTVSIATTAKNEFLDLTWRYDLATPWGAGLELAPVNLFVDESSAHQAWFITSATLTPIGGVPEPAAWSLMLMGVGAVGAGLRTRRRKTLVA
jgi:hypothetical protein